MRTVLSLFFSVFLIPTISLASSVTVNMKLLQPDQLARPIGTIVAQDTPYGLLLTPHLKQLTPGVYGFHVHENPSCAMHGDAAGGHLDPAKTGKHLGPYNSQGHLGDLPVIVVNSDGHATLPVLAPRLALKDILDHSLMIHFGPDNYNDQPQPLGGGMGRMVCGVVPNTVD